MFLLRGTLIRPMQVFADGKGPCTSASSNSSSSVVPRPCGGRRSRPYQNWSRCPSPSVTSSPSRGTFTSPSEDIRMRYINNIILFSLSKDLLYSSYKRPFIFTVPVGKYLDLLIAFWISLCLSKYVCLLRTRQNGRYFVSISVEISYIRINTVSLRRKSISFMNLLNFSSIAEISSDISNAQ